MKHICLLFFVSLFILTKSQAQKADTSSKDEGYNAMPEMLGLKLSGSSFSFVAGYKNIDFSSFNDEFKQAGIPEAAPHMATVGGNFTWVFSNVVFNAGFGGSITDESSNTDYIVENTGGYGRFNLGYVVAHRAGWYLYPTAGYYHNTNELTIRPNKPTPAFNAVLTNPGQSSHFTVTNHMANISLNFDWRLSARESYREEGGFVLGLEVGYSHDLTRPRWQLDLKSISGTPTDQYGLFFVRLKIGFSDITVNR